MSLRLVPTPSHASTTPSAIGAPSAPGVHDTLRHNLALTSSAPAKSSTSLTSTTTSGHPLESRLHAWKQTQDALKHSMLRRQFGLAEPVRRAMELGVVAQGEWRPSVLGPIGHGGSAGVHRDILEGRDWECSWEDVFEGDVFAGAAAAEGMGFHAEMETRSGMDSW
ncbi:hypothetical protein B0A48_05108 [Cryoendolithus antarcticus]|uniref:Proteasome maturation factor UMP1 n=1 Tax=Cryoendolithus antarcticus TaxID=1507870 RepID=A0A1V8TEA1_9PEZI|nr:hypothetical protein B0A48_05108 [Cryoendolithus antarcticus]